jgi:hypothetical protein
MTSLRRLAYGRPKHIPGHGKTWNKLADVGVKVRQVFIFRPVYGGTKIADKVWKR